MQRIEKNGGLCHGEQKANSYNSRKNSLKTFVFGFVVSLSSYLSSRPLYKKPEKARARF